MLKSKHGKRYSAEFKKDAVLYYRSSGTSYREIAAELEVSDASLYTWNKEFSKKENPTSDALKSTEREEIHRLRRFIQRFSRTDE